MLFLLVRGREEERNPQYLGTFDYFTVLTVALTKKLSFTVKENLTKVYISTMIISQIKTGLASTKTKDNVLNMF